MKKLIPVLLTILISTHIAKAQNTFPASGNVGIGTSSPSNLLEVKSTSAATNPAIESENDLNTSSYFYTGRSGNTGIINKTVIENASGNQILLNPSGGNIGIGTTSPNASLDINGSLHAGSFFKLTPSGRVNGNLIFSQSNDQNVGIIRGNNLGIEFLTYVSGVWHQRMAVAPNGNVGIGTTDPGSFKLAVEGKIGAREVNITMASPWPDYVFEADYDLRTLEETKDYISENKHLPEIPSASEIGENGIDIGDMNMKLLKKIEELTLHMINQNEKLESQNEMIVDLQKEVSLLKNQ